MNRTTDLRSYGGHLDLDTVDRIDRAAQMRKAMSDVEFMLLEQRLQADAKYIADLTLNGDDAAVREYVASTRFIERRNAWRAGRTA
jgi:hypothetical protein